MRPLRRARGVTLIELVVAMVVVAIVVAATIYFVNPVRQSVDLAGRAELTDIADNALQRIGRDVRLALPNSVRTTTSGASVFVEFLEVRTAGRYRGDSGSVSAGNDCADTGIGQPASDELSFDAAIDQCFMTIGTLPNASQVSANDFLVLNNHGPGFDGQNAYATAGTMNRRQVTAVLSEASRERVSFTSATAFDRTLHDSPGKRFYIITGPVSYECNTGTATLTRYWGYAIQAAQPTSFASGSSALIAENVVAPCAFDYAANVAPQIGLLTLRLTLQKALSGGAVERVSLYHALHVSNVP